MRKIIIIFAIILILVLIIKAAIFNSVDSLCVLASLSGRPSTLSNLFMDRIYEIAENKDISDILISRLKKSNKQALHGLYLRILGVIGEKKALNDFMFTYFKYQDEKESLIISDVLNCIGLLGEEKVAIFLEKIINKKGQWVLLNYLIARSLYLLTGKKNSFINPKGEMQEFYTTNDLIKAREVILATRDRKRCFQEMIVLDNLFRR